MCRTDDPVRDYDRYEAEVESAMKLLPVCSECGERIQDDFCYQLYDEIICEECLNINYRKMTVDLTR